MYCDSPQWVLDILGQRSLLDCALDVHMTNTGSYPRYNNSYDDDLRALKWRYDNWTANDGLGCEFDRAVYSLIKTVLKESKGGMTLDTEKYTVKQAREASDLVRKGVNQPVTQSLYRRISEEASKGRKYLRYNLEANGFENVYKEELKEELISNGFSVSFEQLQLSRQYCYFIVIRW